MQPKNMYIVKVEEDTNTILSVEKVEGSASELMHKTNSLNKTAENGIRYLPMPNCKQEPRVGFDATQELKKSVDMSGFDEKEYKDSTDTALKVVGALLMTIRGTGHVLIPGISAEQAEEALQIVFTMLIGVQAMQSMCKKDENEKKAAVKDLFKKLHIGE